MFQTATYRPLLVLMIVLFTCNTFVSGMFIHYSNKPPEGLNVTERALEIDANNFEVDSSTLKQTKLPSNLGINVPYYKNISKISMDERCRTGKPLGVAFMQNSPYANTLPTLENKTYKLTGFIIYGILPAVIKKAVSVCCHPNTTIKFAKLLTSQKITVDDYDFYLPFYGDDMDATSYHDNPFIPIVQAPNVVLLVYNDNSKEAKTALIIMTIFQAWPMLVFLLLMACSSGIIMWALDHSQNSEDFPQPFPKGAWEGFWWAFITLTTVGYGDRLPKSYLGRAFCIMWIIFGVVNISIFTGIITAAFSASTKSYFPVHGAKIGAVSGSKEFQLGYGLNADMIAFPNSINSLTALLTRQVDGVLIDNFVAMHSGKEIIKKSLRVERMIKYPITYGVALRRNSSYLDGCVRKYILDNPQDVFKMITVDLDPIQNPADKQNLQLKEAEKLFYQSDTFNKFLMYAGIGFGAMMIIGILWQLFIYLQNKRNAKSNKFSHEVVTNLTSRLGSFQKVDGSLKELIEQYKCFQDGWVNKLKSIHED